VLNVWDYERAAAERLDAGALGYFAGGAGDELTLDDNVAAMRRWRLRPRVLVDVTEVTTATTVLGTPVSFPLIVAPVAMQKLVHPGGEVAAARAAAAAGTIYTLSTIATSRPEELPSGSPKWMQVYVFKDRGMTRSMVDAAVECGFQALVLTVDAPVAGLRERDLRTSFVTPPEVAVAGLAGTTIAETLQMIERSMTWKDLERMAEESAVPVLVKGVQTAEDGRLAVEHGAAGIVVSNHGGRQLDGVAATIDLLPEVVDAVDGRVEVLMDGGVRRGTDIARALALGARAVLAGRAPLWGLAVNGEAGARHVLELLQAEFLNAMTLLGCRTPAELGPAHVRRCVTIR
jgi:isopentenyl diphosphate isomerase/L-lactate dehydrogenase-like FMN-dependent dehydrogenase